MKSYQSLFMEQVNAEQDRKDAEYREQEATWESEQEEMSVLGAELFEQLGPRQTFWLLGELKSAMELYSADCQETIQ